MQSIWVSVSKLQTVVFSVKLSVLYGASHHKSGACNLTCPKFIDVWLNGSKEEQEARPRKYQRCRREGTE